MTTNRRNFDEFLLAYMDQRHNAKRRRIPWQFEFEQWKQWWIDTGKWEQRGRTKDAFVMCRFGDRGPYSIDNVYPETVSHNGRQAQVTRRCKR